MKNVWWVVAIAILMAGTAFAQVYDPVGVHIKENVSISPSPSLKTLSAVTHRIRIEFWSERGGDRLYVASSPCGVIGGDVVYYDNAPNSVVINVDPAPAGTYYISPQGCVACLSPGQAENAGLVIYLDDVPVVQKSYRFGGSYSDIYMPLDWVSFSTPYNSSFDFSISPKWLFGAPYIMRMSPTNNCDPTSWSSTDPLTLTIVSGSQYASFHQTANGADDKIGSSVTTTGSNITNYALVFDGALADSSYDSVVVEASSSGITRRGSVLVPGRPIVRITPPEIYTGEIALVTATEDWPLGGGAFLAWEAGIINGENYGTLLGFNNQTGSYLGNAPMPLQFMASDNLESDSAMVEIRVGADWSMLASIVPGGNGGARTTGNGVVKGSIVNSASQAAARIPISQNVGTAGTKSILVDESEFSLRNYGVAWVKVKKATIMLGETKYYYATMGNGRLSIHETTEPQTNSALGSVMLYTYMENDSDRDPIYGDYLDSDGNDLPWGVVRLIGRYWEDGKPHKTILEAYDTITGVWNSTEIEVKKPAKLGNSHSTVTDVFGTFGNPNLNLDSLIIKYAGENGIPPQLIKGQMEQECLDPSTGQFEPQWRYEPFQDAKTNANDEIFRNNQFVITDNSTGGSFPSTHTNVQPVDYNRTQVKISKYLIDNWFSKYVQRGKIDKEPDVIIGSKGLTQEWEIAWDKFRRDQKTLSPKEAAHNFVKALVTDATKRPGKAFDRLAQTRIMTSYGFTQLMYTLAITDGKFNAETDGRYAPTKTQYMDKTDASRYPEMLNEQNILMPRYCDRLLRNLKKLFPPGRIPAYMWETERGGKGFEANWKVSLQYYNKGRSGYGDEVWSKAQHYLPQQ
jgi:hypothetical protein